MQTPGPRAALAPETSSQPSAPARMVQSRTLLMGAREIHIAHGAETYRLTVTRQGKLILTK